MRVRREDCYHSHVCRVDKTHLQTSLKRTNFFNHTLIPSWFTLQVTAAVFSSCLFLLISHVFLILSFPVTLLSHESHKKKKQMNIFVFHHRTQIATPCPEMEIIIGLRIVSCHLQTDRRRSTRAAPLRRFKHRARRALLTSETWDKLFKRLWQETLPPGCDWKYPPLFFKISHFSAVLIKKNNSWRVIWNIRKHHLHYCTSLIIAALTAGGRRSAHTNTPTHPQIIAPFPCFHQHDLANWRSFRSLFQQKLLWARRPGQKTNDAHPENQSFFYELSDVWY